MPIFRLITQPILLWVVHFVLELRGRVHHFGEKGFLRSIHGDAQEFYWRAVQEQPALAKSGSDFLGLINGIQGGNYTDEQKRAMLAVAEQALSNPSVLEGYQAPPRNPNLFEQVAIDLGEVIPKVIDDTTVGLGNAALGAGEKAGRSLGQIIRGVGFMRGKNS